MKQRKSKEQRITEALDKLGFMVSHVIVAGRPAVNFSKRGVFGTIDIADLPRHAVTRPLGRKP